MKDVDYYRLVDRVNRLTADLEELKGVITNNVMTSSKNEEMITAGLSQTAATLVGLCNVLTSKTALDISEDDILNATKAVHEEYSKEDTIKEPPLPEAEEDPHAGAFIFRAT